MHVHAKCRRNSGISIANHFTEYRCQSQSCHDLCFSMAVFAKFVFWAVNLDGSVTGLLVVHAVKKLIFRHRTQVRTRRDAMS